MRDSWHPFDCTHCNATNWVQEWGDESDPSDEACKCWKCKKLFWIMEMDWITSAYGDDVKIEDVVKVNGEERAGGNAMVKNLAKLLRRACAGLEDRNMVYRMKCAKEITQQLEKLGL